MKNTPDQMPEGIFGAPRAGESSGQLPRQAEERLENPPRRLGGRTSASLSTGPAVRLENIGKLFRSPFLRKGKWALRRLSFEVGRGEIFGLLGPNGAGKTTALKLLAGLIFPTEGDCTLFGLPPGDPGSRAAVGFLPENPCFYERVSTTGLLTFFARLAGVSRRSRKSRVEEMISILHLEEWADTEIRKLSKGNLQKVGIAQAIIGNPELVILDEPMSSLDPVGRREVRELFLSLKEKGAAILFSTHIIPDVEAICDKVGIMKEGALVRVLNMRRFSQTQGSFEVLLKSRSRDTAERLLSISSEVKFTSEGILAVLRDDELLKAALRITLEEDAELLSVCRAGQKLEESFIREVAGS